MEIYLRQRYGIVCLITIALLLVFSHLYNHSSASRRFRRMCIYALCHVVLTILTEVTANLLDTTPLLVNRLLHLLCCICSAAQPRSLPLAKCAGTLPASLRCRGARCRWFVS